MQLRKTCVLHIGDLNPLMPWGRNTTHLIASDKHMRTVASCSYPLYRPIQKGSMQVLCARANTFDQQEGATIMLASGCCQKQWYVWCQSADLQALTLCLCVRLSTDCSDTSGMQLHLTRPCLCRTPGWALRNHGVPYASIFPPLMLCGFGCDPLG
jgi:hypothetical protein